jgi:hypothetical protein
MSVLLLAGAAALGLAYVSQPDPKNKSDEPVAFNTKPMKYDEQVTDFFPLHGVYGDIADVSSMLKFPGMIVGIKVGQDLRGTPCRWLKMRNRCVYRTYDMDTEYN